MRIVVVAALFAGMPALAQAPCLEPLPSGLVLPAPDAVAVPTNVTPIVSFVGAHLEVGGVQVPARVETIEVSREPSFALFQRHIPDVDFEIGDRVDVVPARGGVLASFTIGVEDDDEPPVIPPLAVEQPIQDCRPYVKFVDAAIPPDVVLIAKLGTNPTFTDNDRIDAINDGPSLIVPGPAGETAAVVVAPLDHAGNLGEAQSFTATFPKLDDGGCSATGFEPGFAALLLALKKRRRTSSRSR